MGLRFRVGVKVEPDVRRTVDIAFTKVKLAVLVDGCFWHGCPIHSRPVKTNAAFWTSKIAVNQARDADTNVVLRSYGWTVLRFWEHDEPEEAAARIEEQVRKLREKSNSAR